MPWGYTDNGDECYWLYTGEELPTKIVIYESRSPENHVYDMTFLEFIYAIVSKEMVCEAFPEDFLEDDVSYFN